MSEPFSTRNVLRQPLLVSALGLAPLLARSETLITALGMGMIFASAFLSSALIIGALRRFIPWSFRLIFILLITTTSVTIHDRFVQAWLFELHAELGIYIPLIAVNTLLMATLEETILRYPVRQTLKIACLSAVSALLVVAAVGLIRGLLGRGGLLLDAAALLPGGTVTGFAFTGDGLPVMGAAAGAFLTLGCVIAGLRYLWLDGEAAESPRAR